MVLSNDIRKLLYKNAPGPCVPSHCCFTISISRYKIPQNSNCKYIVTSSDPLTIFSFQELPSRSVLFLGDFIKNISVYRYHLLGMFA